MTKFNRTVLAAAGFAIAAVALPAQAQQVLTTTIQVQAADLANPAGRARVIRKIEFAAQALCRPDNFAERVRTRMCKANAIEAMIGQTRDPLLMAEWKAAGALRTAQRD